MRLIAWIMTLATFLSLLILGGCLQTSQPPTYEVLIKFRLLEHESFPTETQIVSVMVTLSQESKELWSKTFAVIPQQLSLYLSPGTYFISMRVNTTVGSFNGTANQKLEPGENVVSILLCPSCGG